MNKLQRRVTKQYVPGTPTIPASPGYCYTVEKSSGTSGVLSSSSGQFSSYFTAINGIPAGATGISLGGYAVPVYRQVEPYISPTTGQLVTQELIGYTSLRGAPGGGTASRGVSLNTYTTNTETVCVEGTPEIPGIPAQVTEQNAGPDWQASARSIEKKAGDVAATFFLNGSPRVIIGFSDVDRGANVADIRMGVVFARSGATTVVRPVINGVQGSSVGTYTAGDKVELSRVAGRFNIRVGGSTVYGGAATTSEPVYLDAMLYTSTDFVNDPVLSNAASVAVTGGVGFTAGLSTSFSVTGGLGFSGSVNLLADGESALQVAASVGFSTAATLVETESVAVSGGVGFSVALADFESFSGANLSLKALEMQAADYAVVNGFVVLPAVQMTAYGGTPDTEIAGGDLVLAPLISAGIMYTGGLITSSTELSSLVMLGADRSYAAVDGSLPSLVMYADDGFGVENYYGFNNDLIMASPFLADPTLIASWNDGLQLAPDLSVAILLEESMFDILIMDDTMSFQALVNALIENGLSLRSATRLPVDELNQLAFDLRNGAATRYDNFDFLQFAYTDTGTYAVKKDGVYKLRPGDDDGVERSALVDFGAGAMTTFTLKYMSDIYIGVSADGTMYAKLTADNGEPWVYRVVGETPTRRVKTGRGLSAREWSLKLEWVDSTAVELESVEFVFAGSGKRRIR